MTAPANSDPSLEAATRQYRSPDSSFANSFPVVGSQARTELSSPAVISRPSEVNVKLFTMLSWPGTVGPNGLPVFTSHTHARKAIAPTNRDPSFDHRPFRTECDP